MQHYFCKRLSSSWLAIFKRTVGFHSVPFSGQHMWSHVEQERIQLHGCAIRSFLWSIFHEKWRDWVEQRCNESLHPGMSDIVSSINENNHRRIHKIFEYCFQAGDMEDTPVIANNNIVTDNPMVTDQHHPRYTDHLCKKDCPTEDSLICMRVLGNAFKMLLFDIVQKCSTERFGWMDETLWTALSTNTNTTLFPVLFIWISKQLTVYWLWWCVWCVMPWWLIAESVFPWPRLKH